MGYTQPTFDALVAEVPAHLAAVAKQSQRQAKRDEAKMLKHDTKRVNEVLWKMGRTYHDSVPLDLVNALLEYNGFTALDAMLLCGRQGQLHESVGRNRWLALSWYKMESGRYEVVAYLS